jgi:hypothetical protein
MGTQSTLGPVIIPFSVPAAASATTIGTQFSLANQYDKIVLISTLTGMSVGTLDLYIEESWDLGTSWYQVGHFTQLAGGAAASTKRQLVAYTGTGTATATGKSTLGTATLTLAAGTFLEAPWAPLLRIISVTGAGANAGPVVQTFTFCPWQQSH